MATAYIDKSHHQANAWVYKLKLKYIYIWYVCSLDLEHIYISEKMLLDMSKNVYNHNLNFFT